MYCVHACFCGLLSLFAVNIAIDIIIVVVMAAVLKSIICSSTILCSCSSFACSCSGI